MRSPIAEETAATSAELLVENAKSEAAAEVLPSCMVVPFQADFTAIYNCVPKENSEGSPKEIQKIVVFLFINVVRQEKKKDPSGSSLVCAGGSRNDPAGF